MKALKHTVYKLSIPLGFALLTALALIIGVIGQQALDGVLERTNKADDANRMVKFVLDLRGEEKNYMLRDNLDEAREVRAIIERIAQQVEETRLQFESEQNNALMDDLDQQLLAYQDAFNRYVEIDRDAQQAQGTMEAAARQVESNLEDFREQQKAQVQNLLQTGTTQGDQVLEELREADAANRLVKLMLEARRDEKNFQLRGDEQSLAQVVDGIEQLRDLAQELLNSAERQSTATVAEAVLRELADYQRAFNAFREGRAEQQALRPVLVDRARALEADAEKLRSDQKRELLSESRFANGLILVTIALALALGVSAVIVVLRKVTRPIGQLVDTMNQVCEEGDFSLRVPDQGNNEVAMAGRAVNALLSQLQDALQEAESAVSGLARGDFSQSVRGEYSGDLAALKGNINDSLAEVDQTISALNGGIESLASAQFGKRVEVDAEGAFGHAAEQLNTAMAVVDTAIGEVNDSMESMAAGRFDARIKGELPGDLGTLKSNINRSLERVDAGIDEVVRMASALAQGDLTARIDGHYEGQLARLANGLNRGVKRLGETLAVVASASESVTNGIDQIASGNRELSNRTQTQAASLEETAASMEEMTSTVQQASQNTDRADELSQKARQQAVAGSESMELTISTMHEINAASKKITEIVGMIDGIAFQTNLLALNAAVEAARAGEQGRGFAVVANEVRGLAQKSADAARQVRTLIDDSTSRITSGTEQVESSGAILSEINQAIDEVSRIVADIAVGGREQSSGIEQVNTAVVSMDETTQQNAALVEEITSVADTVEANAKSLGEQIAQFKLSSNQHVALRS